MNEFYQDITIVLLDKLVIGFLILLAGYMFNRILEKFKLGQQKELVQQPD